MGFFDSLTSKLNLKGNQSEEFRQEVQKYKTKYVNLSRDELRTKLIRPENEAEKVGLTELLYGVGIVGTAVPIVSSLFDSLKNAVEQTRETKNQGKKDGALAEEPEEDDADAEAEEAADDEDVEEDEEEEEEEDEDDDDDFF